MNKCPCINCITFPICKAQVNEYIHNRNMLYKKNLQASRYYNIYDDVLSLKCSLIGDWINEVLEFSVPHNELEWRFKEITNLFIKEDYNSDGL